ncbi:hypothetical protein GCK72_004393 [Caenorhabditis remanei]|uniref:Uncharacterized protein n=1 Tax=Caenorhabditis remanei TaxID=31234 RepID=A0A6A5HB46_CAERE|nr:hypothetical protein GCK72_004393 [Caenorhabditis remanei]KAF1764445.1 hypothetical protein GCK72_004393 [Caenorhabditis remanei]
MPTVPLQYETLKSVLLYMEPNIRFEVSLHMPSISTLEKRIPLKIRNLTFSTPQNEKCLKINQFNYRLGVYCDFGDMDVPSDFQFTNDRDGAPHDFDQYGFSITRGRNTILPGDVDLRKEVLEELWGNYSEDTMQHVVKKLRMLKRLFAERTNQEYSEDDGFPPEVGPKDVTYESRNRRNLEYSPDEFIESMIKKIQDSLKPYLHRRNKTKPPFTCWIQLTINSPNSRQPHRFPYHKTLFEAEKHLITQLFGKRKSMIPVKNLKIGHENEILRFPVATKMSIENLEVGDWNAANFEAFGNIIDSSSLPLQRLKLRSSIPTSDFTHQIVKESKCLVINNLMYAELSWTPILQNLTNQKVLLLRENRLHPPNNYVDLIENWLETGRPVGTTFIMEIRKEETVKQCLETLKQRHDVYAWSERLVQLRINSYSMLDVCYEATFSLYMHHQPEWLLSLTVVPSTAN